MSDTPLTLLLRLRSAGDNFHHNNYLRHKITLQKRSCPPFTRCATGPSTPSPTLLSFFEILFGPPELLGS